jgi:DNA polymerase-3 subunit delta'
MTDNHALAPLPWQGESWSQVASMIEQDRLPHALLIHGEQGIGKLQFLQALAGRLLCHTPGDALACGNCQSCSLLNAGSHSDYIRIEPEPGARVIKVDQVRSLIEFAAKTPALGRVKAILLGPAESMNLNASNALLKCLEEPSPSTRILLYSHRRSGIPATVLSRCQQIRVHGPDQETALGWLANITGSDEAARQMLALYPGKPLRARAVHDAAALEQQLAVREGLRALQAGSLSPLDFPALVSDQELADVLALMQEALEHAVRQRLLAGEAGLEDVFRLRDEFARLRNAVAAGANPNHQLIIEDCATRMATALCV